MLRTFRGLSSTGISALGVSNRRLLLDRLRLRRFWDIATIINNSLHVLNNAELFAITFVLDGVMLIVAVDEDSGCTSDFVLDGEILI